MTAVLDLDNLRDITGGDKELEKELFAVFLESSESCIQALKASTEPAQSEEWRKQAHAWKGISFNLGAAQLGELCKIAQDRHTDDAAAKTALLAQMESAYNAVKEALKGA